MIELKKIAEVKYKYDSDEDEEEKQFVYELRKNFINNFNKKNNRQFKLIKYKI